MKQGKAKKSAAQATAPAATPELPDAAYVDQLLGVTAAAAPVVSDVEAPVTAEVSDVTTDLTIDATSDVTVDVTGNGVIELPAQCLLRDAVEYRQRLLDCLEAEAVVVDVGAVERIDTAFIQVLVSFARTRATKAPVSWRRVSPEFAASVRLLGVQAVLSVPDVSDAA